MELQLPAISDQVKAIKETMFAANIDPYSLVAPSAYDTAWLAMIPDHDHDLHKPLKPMFGDCLEWVLNNQNKQGFWGECDGHGNPTIECLIATLACIIALRRWKVGTRQINKGLAYFRSSAAEKLLQGVQIHCPRWFAIVFSGMVELAQQVGDPINVQFEVTMQDVFYRRQRILETEQLVDKSPRYPTPLLSYLEALPPSYVEEENIIKHLSNDGSLFQSPSATARAFLATGNEKCLSYLQFLAQRFSKNGVPSTYPIDEDLIKLCVINHVQRLGLADHFSWECEQVLQQVYKNFMSQKSSAEPFDSSTTIQMQLLKDSLAFRLLRMHGYRVLPWNVCRFLYSEEVRDVVENNYEQFSGVLLNLYRATDLAFPGEFELQEARTFSRKLLEKSISREVGDRNPFRRLIEHELSLPWIARLDHLEHRLWMEENETNALWMGKTSVQRLASLHNDKLVTLAIGDYEFRQSIYRTELEHLRRWARDWGLSNMGFGREKTTYCYFAVAASSSLPSDSDIRMIAAKSAIIITVADDFFDMKGSLEELTTLTDAIRRWDAKGLCGEGKIIFNALDNLVSEMATKYCKQRGSDLTSYFRDIWYETFLSWLTESKWSKNGSMPSMDEYLKVGMISIATHTVVLPASCYLEASSPNSKLQPLSKYETLTKLLMIIPRLLNDVQSYEKEKDEGKPNSILLYLKDNPEVDISKAIAYVRGILNEKEEEFLEHVLMDDITNLPKDCRHLHLSCLKVFQMFFNSSNRYDSDTEMLDEIAKAIYIPPEQVQHSKNQSLAKPLLSLPSKITKCSAIKYHGFGRSPKNLITSSLPPSTTANSKTTMPLKFNFCFL